jgi:hypothetical protein
MRLSGASTRRTASARGSCRITARQTVRPSPNSPFISVETCILRRIGAFERAMKSWSVRAAVAVGVASLSVVACGGKLVVPPSDGGIVPLPPSDGTPITCAALGGHCGMGLPCARRDRMVLELEDCEDHERCCVPLPVPADGACWDITDCIAAVSPPDRSSDTAECVAPDVDHQVQGRCSCTSAGAIAIGSRCGPTLAPDEQMLCSISHRRFTAQPGTCGNEPCDSGRVCFASGSQLICQPDYFMVDDPREFCVVVNCGSIRCDAPLRCIDATNGICAR